VREHFDRFLTEDTPRLLPLYRRLYPGTRAPAGVERRLAAVVDELRHRYGLAGRPAEVAPRASAADECASRPTADSQLRLGL
jgi:hypothetical protein